MMLVELTTSTATAAASGQGWRQLGELLLAFGLSSAIGLERQLRGKSAGLRTQSIVGTTAALILLVSKYGFGDVLASGQVVLDPSRVAAQVVSGVGFLGAGLIITRRGSIRGLTTAAAVWETAAIGLAAGAGLGLLAAAVTLLHFVAVFGFTALAHRLPGARSSELATRVRYLDGLGILREVMSSVTSSGWTINTVITQDVHGMTDNGLSPRSVAVVIGLAGSGDRGELLTRLAGVDGVLGVDVLSEDDLD